MKRFFLPVFCFTSFMISAQSVLDTAFLTQKIDSIIQLGLDSSAYPGAQVLVSHRGEIRFHKTYGYHTYVQDREVQKQHIYDLASVTKVTSGLPVLMKLYDEGKFDLDAPLKKYLPKFKNSNKADLTFREMLSHQAGLKPYIVFWAKTLRKNGKFRHRTFKKYPSEKFPIPITDSLYLHRNYRKKMYKAIAKSNVESEKKYKYSGLLFLLMPEIISNITGADFEEYLHKNIYEPINVKLTYNPLERFHEYHIIPTETDTVFRKTLVHGRVHDEAAAMLNGVSCNAGLFGSAEDLAKIFQLYINEGNWEGRQIISQNAVREFTKAHYLENENRRGLGFDKPPIEWEEGGSYIAKDASPESFGHSGFTGTFVWADPTEDLIVIFLSNRVFPFRSSRKLYSMNIRPLIHQAVYDAVK